MIVFPFEPCRLGEKWTKYVVFAFRDAEGVNVRVVRSVDQTDEPATCGPVTDPSCTITSISMPVIMGIVKLIAMGFVGSTPTVPAAGVRLDSAGAPASGALAASVGDIPFLQAEIAIVVARMPSVREMADMAVQVVR